MFFKISLYLATTIFGLGLLYRVGNWFHGGVAPDFERDSAPRRVLAACKGILATVISAKVFTLLKSLLFDILLQFRILKESRLRWVTHMLISYGFILLLLMHALDAFVTERLFSDYSAAGNPFLFLRNLFGFLMILGLALAVYRRGLTKARPIEGSWKDGYLLAILAVIAVSGFVLEGAKIVSPAHFQGMVQDYADEDDEALLRGLEAYWVAEFGLASSKAAAPVEEEVLAEGREIHETSCAACHARPHWAFLSFGLAASLRPIAASLDRLHFSWLLLHVHFLACFMGLAYLPFSRMFHIFAGPLSLLANAVMDSDASDPANIVTRQVLELDACMHCGTCTARCSVGVCYALVHNLNILPSERMDATRALAAGKGFPARQLRSLQEGLYFCTNCYRCTDACPVGINLQDLWFNARESLLERGGPETLALSPLSFYRGLRREDLSEDRYARPLRRVSGAIEERCRSLEMYEEPIDLRLMDAGFRESMSLSSMSRSFSSCYICTTCTAACPVVRNFEHPPAVLGLVPHQIIHAVSLGMKEPIYRSQMLWTCLGCYQCQQECPQGVRVTDIIYELKSMAVAYMKGNGAEPPQGKGRDNEIRLTALLHDTRVSQTV